MKNNGKDAPERAEIRPGQTWANLITGRRLKILNATRDEAETEVYVEYEFTDTNHRTCADESGFRRKYRLVEEVPSETR